MTVAVSTSSAIDQIVSVVPGIYDVRVEIGLRVDRPDHVGNLRGLRESGNIFAVPTYLFVVPGAADGRARRRSTSSPATRRRRSAAGRRPEPVGDRGARPLPAPQGVRRRLGRADRGRGDRQRRPGVQAAGGEERRQHDDGRWPILLAILFIGITVVRPGLRRSSRRSLAAPTVVALVAATVFGAGSLFYRLPGRDGAASCSSPRTRASTRSRGSPRSSPRTASCPASSRSAATGSRTLGDRRPGRRSPACLLIDLRRRHARPDPALLGRRVRLLHAQPDRHGPPLAARPRVGLAVAGGGQRVRRGPDRGRPRRRRHR